LVCANNAETESAAINVKRNKADSSSFPL